MKFTSVIVAALALLPVLAFAQERTIDLFNNPILLPKSAKDIMLTDLSIRNLASRVQIVETNNCGAEWSSPCTEYRTLAKTKVLQATISYLDRNAPAEQGEYQTAQINLPLNAISNEQLAVIIKHDTTFDLMGAHIQARRNVMKKAMGLSIKNVTQVVMVPDMENSDLCPFEDCSDYQEQIVYKPYNQVNQEVTVILKK